METAVRGLIDASNLNAVQGYVKTASTSLQKITFTRILQSGGQGSASFLESFQDLSSRLHPEALGCYLCAFMVRASKTKQKFVFESLKKANHEVVSSFLKTLSEYTGDIRQPRQIFRIMLIIPYINPENEALIGEIVERIVDIIKKQFPHLLSYTNTMISTNLETVFGKIKKGFLSMKGAKGRSTLLILLFAKIIEKYASPNLLNKIQKFFQASLLTPSAPLIEAMNTALKAATEEDRNRFRACIPLFQTKDVKVRLLVSSNLSHINLDRPNLLRRLNRLVRVTGNFGIRQSVNKLVEIIKFARDERIDFLEETTVVTLCQFFHRGTIENFKLFIKDPTQNSVSMNGYARGLRFLPARLLFQPFLTLLSHAGLYAYTKDIIIDSLKYWDLSGIKNAIPTLLEVIQSPHLAVEQKIKLGEILSGYSESTYFQMLIDLSNSNDDILKIIAVRSLSAVAKKDPNILMDVLTNRLYTMLDRDSREVQIQALLALIDLGDDYAFKVLKDQLNSEGEAYTTAVLAEVEKQITHGLLTILLNLLESPSSMIQHALRDTLTNLIKGPFAEEIRDELVNYLKGTKQAIHDEAAEDIKEADTADTVVEHAKIEFKFKRENSQLVTVFFIDIVSYTERSSISDTTTLMNLIKSFEDIVLPDIDMYRGSLIKKMGDGILAAFKHPVNAALAALSIQKKIADYNKFRVGKDKFSVRIGLNTGLVIRKDNDIFGNVVNVASRMETTANPGEILLTRDTYDEIKGHVNCTALGNVQVKGIKDAILVYSAESVKKDSLKLHIDPEKEISTSQTKRESLDLIESIVAPSFTLPSNLAINSKVPETLQELFKDLTKAVAEIAGDYHQENAFNSFLQSKWNELMESLSSSPKQV
jgi:class 3 adenylate cyclase